MRTLTLRRETLAALSETELADIGAGTQIGSRNICISEGSCICGYTQMVCLTATCLTISTTA